jgi:hypothetical protein
MSYTNLDRQIGRHWYLALVACALLVVSTTQVVHANGYGNSYQYPYQYSYDTYYNGYYGSSYPYYYGSDYYRSYDYNSAYPTNYYPYGSHYTHHGYSNPSCSISITPATNYSRDTYRWGYPMQLTWSSSNATSASISPDVGSVSPSGSRVVYATGSIYSMSVYGPGGSATCQTSGYSIPFYHQNYNYSYPQNYYTYPSTYYTPTYTYPTTYSYPATYTSGAANVVNNYVVGSSSSAKVSLTQIPYTGVDMGLWGNALAYLAITLLAALGAIALLRRQAQAFRVLMK